MSLNIELKDGKASYRPGEAVEGEACWTLEPAPAALVLKLGWTSEAPGRFTNEFTTAVEQRIENPAPGHAHHAFRLEAPDGPWSFVGELLAIRWSVRLEDGEGRTGEQAIVIAPGGRPLGKQA